MKNFFLALMVLFSFSVQAKTKHPPPPSYDTLYVANESKKETLVDINSDLVRPIASITKLMSAIVVLDKCQPLNEKLTFKGSRSLPKGKYTREELLSAMLVKSDNVAAETLAKNYPGGNQEFYLQMNKTAEKLGMKESTFVDASGIGEGNKSTAKELTTLLKEAYRYDIIKRHASSAETYLTAEVHQKKKKKLIEKIREVKLSNTSHELLKEFNEIIISKTGTTSHAGKCLVLLVRKNDEFYSIVILGDQRRKHVTDTAKRLLTQSI